MKINQSRKSTVSIMSNPHFGGVLLKKGNAELFIPNEMINKKGKLKKYALDLWKQELAKHNINKAV